MKTTLEIDDGLSWQAEGVARQRNTSLRRAVVEEALQALLEPERAGAGQPIRLRRRKVEGRGLQPAIEGDWATIRALAYEGPGG